jgi:hypothetical protein
MEVHMAYLSSVVTGGEPNHSVERTEASRSDHMQFECLRRLASAAHADRWVVGISRRYADNQFVNE